MYYNEEYYPDSCVTGCCQLVILMETILSMSYQKGTIGSTASSTVPVLRRITHTFTNGY
jgi:hypothetical protein